MNDYPGQLVAFLEERKEYSPRTIRFYNEQARLVLKALWNVFPNTDPVNLTVDELKVFVQYMRGNYAVSTQKDYLIALKRMCELNDNQVFTKYRVMFPTDTRPNVDWLTFEQAQELLSLWKMPLDEMIVVLELLHGLRRVEVIRLRLRDIHFDGGYLEVRGKGRAGGKLRSVPMHPQFKQAFDRWMIERNEMLAKADNGPQCDNLLVYLRRGKLRQYEELKGRAIDDHLQELSNRTGIEFSNHTLRRTFGRELHRSGVSIVVIAAIFGHTSTTQTMKYLGLDLDDMSAAMSQLRLKIK
jgi:integrase